MESLKQLFQLSGFHNATPGHFIMMAVGIFFIWLSLKKNFEPLLLVPLGFGILIGNIPFIENVGLKIGLYESGSVMHYLYYGVSTSIYPSLIFLGIGAITDFSSLISNPKLMLLGAATQVGIVITFIAALAFGFTPQQAASVGIIGGADGPTAIFLSSRLAPELLAAVAIAAYSYMALAPLIQPPLMRMLTTKKERLIRMKPARAVSRKEKIIFPVIGLILTAFISPAALPLLGMLFFGNLLRESGVTKRLSFTAKAILIDLVTIILGVTIGASTQATTFLTPHSILIFGLGIVSFAIATVGGVLFAKFMNIFLPEEKKINPLIGAAGVSAAQESARIPQIIAESEDSSNYLLTHATAPSTAGLIGSALTAGILISFMLRLL